MKLIIAALLAIAACSFCVDIKPSLTQAQWETFVDNSRDYTISKLQGSADTSVKLSALIAAAAPLDGKSESYLEDKMEEFYGSDWKNAGGPLHTACQIICAITLSVCYDNQTSQTYWNNCGANYAACLRMCGLLPPGL